MASPNNPVNRGSFGQNIPTQAKRPTLPPKQADIASFKAQLSIANDKVLIGNSNELHRYFGHNYEAIAP